MAAVMFEACTGRRPVHSKSWIETLSRRLYEPPPTDHDEAPDLSPRFAAILQQAMDRDPGRRPPTAGALLDSLEHALVHPHAKPVPHGDWLQPAMRRGRIALSAVPVLLAGVAEAAQLL